MLVCPFCRSNQLKAVIRIGPNSDYYHCSNCAKVSHYNDLKEEDGEREG